MNVRILFHTGETFDDPDDPAQFPFRLELQMRPPDFMIVTWIMLHGGAEEVIAVARTGLDLVAFMRKFGLLRHPRLVRYRMIKRAPDGAPLRIKEVERGDLV